MRNFKRLFSIMFLILFSLTLISGCSNKTATDQNNYKDVPSSSNLSVYFPKAGQDPAPILTGLYDKADSHIDVAIYSLTHPEIVKALVNAKKRNVNIRIITDKTEAKNKYQSHALNTLMLAGIPVKVNVHSGLMHLKLSIIDGKIATTGSYNYTNSASKRNDEMLVVSKDLTFTKTCQQEFDQMWNDNSNYETLISKY